MDEEDDEFDDSPVIPKLKTYKEAINSLEDVCQFLEHKGHGIEALSIGSSITHIVALNTSNSRQATLYECHSMNIDYILYLAHYRPFQSQYCYYHHKLHFDSCITYYQVTQNKLKTFKSY